MYTDLLTKIKNAQKAKKESIKTTYSSPDLAIAQLLANLKFIEAVEKRGRLPKRILEVTLKYDKDGRGAIEVIKFVSKPSRRLYAGYKELRKVRQGYGAGVISTPKGIMTYDGARKAKVGGERLFEIW